MTRLLTAMLVCGWFAVPSYGTSPDPRDLAIPPEELAKARELVRKLGSEVYREREDAQTELTKMGRFARQALVDAASNDPDPEIRFRCSQVLPKSVADDLKARLDTFLADNEGKYEHDLPGLKPFRKQIAADKAARELYIEIAKSPHNIELLQAIDRGPGEAGRAIVDRRLTMYSNLNNFQGRMNGGRSLNIPPSLADIACLLFAESITPSKDVPRGGFWNNITGQFFLQQLASRNTLLGKDNIHAEAYRRIVGTWLETRDDPNELGQLATLGGGDKLAELPQYRQLLKRAATTDGVLGLYKAYAISNLIQHGGKEEIPFLKKLLKDDSVVTTVGFAANGQLGGLGGKGVNPGQVQMAQCLVRDVALALILVQTNQKMEDYGFKFPPGMSQSHMVGIGNYNYAFTSEEARAKALVKFGFWELKQSLKKAEKPE